MIVKNTFFFLASEAVSKSLYFILLYFLAHVLSTSEYGDFSIFNTLLLIFTVLFGLNIDASIYRFFFEKPKKYFVFYFISKMFLIVLNLVWLFILIVFKNSICAYFKLNPQVYVLGLIAAILNIQFIIMQNYYQAKKNAFRYFTYSSGKSLIFFVFTVYFLYAVKLTLLAPLYGFILALIFFLLLIFIFDVKHFKKFLKTIKRYSFSREIKKTFNYIYKYSFPLIFHSLSGVLLGFSDRLIINKLTNPGKVGIYSLAYNFGYSIQILSVALNRIWNPLFLENLQKNNTEYLKKILHYFWKLIITASLFMCLFSKEIVTLISFQKYHSAIAIVPPIVLSSVFIFLYIIFSGYSFYFKKTVYISVATFFSVTLNIILNFLLIPKYGYQIAAYTTLISYIVLFLIHIFIVSKIFKIKKYLFEKSSILDFLFLLGVMCVLLIFSNLSVLLRGILFLGYFGLNWITIKELYIVFINKIKEKSRK